MQKKQSQPHNPAVFRKANTVGNIVTMDPLKVKKGGLASSPNESFFGSLAEKNRHKINAIISPYLETVNKTLQELAEGFTIIEEYAEKYYSKEGKSHIKVLSLRIQNILELLTSELDENCEFSKELFIRKSLPEFEILATTISCPFLVLSMTDKVLFCNETFSCTLQMKHELVHSLHLHDILTEDSFLNFYEKKCKLLETSKQSIVTSGLFYQGGTACNKDPILFSLSISLRRDPLGIPHLITVTAIPL